MSSKSPQTELLDRRFSFSGWTLLLVFTLSVAFLVRVWEIASIPAALHPDELAGVVGMLDEISHRAPLRAFFDFRIMYLPLYGACEYLMTFVFGFTAAAYRFPAVAFGVLTVFFTAALAQRLTSDRLAGAIAGATAAILPWEIVVSRVGWEPAAMLPFLLAGLWMQRGSLQTGSTRTALCAGALFGIGSYSYRAALPTQAVLALALTVCFWKEARASWRALSCGLGVWIAILAPFALSVWSDPDFFWRDRRISTFAHGLEPHSAVTFARNYLAHFDFGALFLHGDGNPDHGPHAGILYLWMLPFVVLGAIAVWRRYGVATGSFLFVWLVLYPIGGAVTNDGVPHFLRTLSGAPLACIFAAIGLSAAWTALSQERLSAYRNTLAALFAIVAIAEFSAFARAYFIDYIPVSANAYQFQNRELFAVVRSYEKTAARACFDDLNGMNSLTLFGYYLRSTSLRLYERPSPDCSLPRTLTITSDAARRPARSRLVATVSKYNGEPADYIYLTNF